ncbi:MAG: glycosyltransferase [Chloroflexi bacterium]|nr:glycosyltransferase [Chloroflexota bacterium]
MHISVVIPVFNRAHLIERTIESILAQDFDDFDLSIVDDASTDETVDIVRKYEINPRVKIFINKINLGLTGNWNRCIELAKGPLVQIVQSDDLIDSNYLSNVETVFNLFPQVGFVAASCRHIDINDKIIGSGTTYPPKLSEAGDDAIITLFTRGHPHVSSIVIKKECFGVVGKYNEKIWTAPDVEMDTRIVSKYAYYHLGSIFTSFRRHGSNRGNIEFLRTDYLETFELGLRLCWGYLTLDGREKMRIHDLNLFIDKQVSSMALSGSIASIAYSRPDSTKRYLLQALRRDKSVIIKSRFWKGIAALLLPKFSSKIVQKKMSMTLDDISRFDSYKNNL